MKPSWMILIAPPSMEDWTNHFLYYLEKHLHTLSYPTYIDRLYPSEFTADLQLETLRKWNVIRHYHQLSDVPSDVLALSRYVVLQSHLIPTVSGPTNMLEGRLQIRAPLLPLRTKWILQKETGQWMHMLPTVPSPFDNNFIHTIPFIVLDRHTHALFPDVH